jgi:hypothetical protein
MNYSNKPPSIQEALAIIVSQINKEYQMTKSAIIDAVLKEAGFMDIVRSLASKINIRIPTKKEAIAKLKEYLTKNPELVDEALRWYQLNMHNIRSSAVALPSPKILMFIAMLMLIIFGYNMAKTTAEIKDNLRQVETQQDIEIQKVLPGGN